MKFASFDACKDVVSKHLLQTVHVGTNHVCTPALQVEVLQKFGSGYALHILDTLPYSMPK